MTMSVAENDCQTCIRGPAESCAKMVACIDVHGRHTMYIEVSPVDLTYVPTGAETLAKAKVHYDPAKIATSRPSTLKTSDGSTASYYELPLGATQLQDLISAKDMNAQLGEIFRAAYRYGYCPHSPKIREIKKIIFYAQAELARLEKLA